MMSITVDVVPNRARVAVVNGNQRSTIRVTQATMATPPSACWASPPQLTISVTP